MMQSGILTGYYSKVVTESNEIDFSSEHTCSGYGHFFLFGGKHLHDQDTKHGIGQPKGLADWFAIGISF